ncbi:MAG: SDR family oxidoreductase [Bacteroidia bacterium]
MPTVFISGASKGIGLALARRFYAADYRVAICARGEAALAEARAALPGIDTYVCDMADKLAVKALAADLVATYGALDILINNAGVFQPGAIHSEDESVYETLMRTNMDSAYYLTRGVLPQMMARCQGTIVNIASIASLHAYANGGSYSISKYALLGFSKNLREELKPYGIGVICVMPGAVLTDAWAGVEVPADRLMPVEDIAELVFVAATLSRRTVVEDIVIRPMLGDL